MLRSLFCAALIFALMSSFCLLPQSAIARRCPVKTPETLLSLYQNSDAIYVAAVEKTIEGEMVEEEESYSVQKIEKHFTISATLKGQSRKFFTLNDRVYHHRAVEEEPERDEAEEESKPTEEPEPEEPEVTEPDYDGEMEDDTKLKSGDTLLLFVRDGDEGEEGPELTDYRDGIKRLPMERISVYEARIRELNSIFAAKKVNGTELLQWVLRCAEDPVTRWEGTFELLSSVQSLEWREKATEQRRERIANGLPVEEEPHGPEVPAEKEDEELPRKNFDTSVFAKMLDINHKQTLANILLNDQTAGADDNGRTKVVPGDRELLELVKRWGDPRLVGFLIDKLRIGSGDVPSRSAAMGTVAEIIRDDEAGDIAQEYDETAYEDDSAVAEPDEEEDAAEDSPAAEVAAKEGGEAEPETDNETVERPSNGEEARPDSPEPRIIKRTYGEIRSDLLQKFLARCDRVTAERDSRPEPGMSNADNR